MSIKGWAVETVKIEGVNLSNGNPRTIGKKALAGLTESIRRFGYVDLAVWNRRTGNILSGHQRLSVLMSEGITEAPMIVVDMPVEEEIAAGLTMNNPMIEGEFDDPILELSGQLEGAAPDLYRAVRIDDLKESIERAMKRPDSSGKQAEGEKWDTECPCCGNKWNVDTKDVFVVRSHDEAVENSDQEDVGAETGDIQSTEDHAEG